jgi:dTDP-4-amino-4,6-dideoxygalactose transaminase
MTRRNFVAATAGTALAAAPGSGDKLAIAGGTPVRRQPFPSWPLIKDNDERAWTEVLRKGRWNRLNGNYAKQFEETWAATMGAKHCLATANGTSALLTALNVLEVGPGDEVIVPPYTFVATINVVLMQHALPVFVDSDRETFQIDARKIEAAITPRTRCLLPVHMAGAAADLDTILAVAKKRNLPVIEDACQAHLGEWRGKKLSTLGDLGCFSFQASKNLNSGEGGALLTNRPDLYSRAWSFHNNGNGTPRMNGCNLRMTEFQAALLLTQLSRVEEQSKIREQNAAYLTAMLKEIPGIAPAKMYEGCTRSAHHLYMFRYDPARFANAPRQKFLAAMKAEGIPCSAGYSPLNKEEFLTNTLNSRAFRAIYTAQQLAEYRERNNCPENDRLCEEGVWFTQTMLLGSRQDMEQIAEAIRKIQRQAAALVSG